MSRLMAILISHDMRLTVMNQMAKGLGPEESESRVGALKQLESIKWHLWPGNVFKALQRIEHLETDLEGEIITGASSEKTRVTLQEFQTYIESNQQWIPNYGELWRAGETISTAFVESAVDQVLSKRFVKKQQMSWSRRGAHLLLQVRTRALNEELRSRKRKCAGRRLERAGGDRLHGDNRGVRKFEISERVAGLRRGR